MATATEMASAPLPISPERRLSSKAANWPGATAPAVVGAAVEPGMPDASSVVGALVAVSACWPRVTGGPVVVVASATTRPSAVTATGWRTRRARPRRRPAARCRPRHPTARSRARARRCEDTPAMVAHGHVAIAAPRTEGRPQTARANMGLMTLVHASCPRRRTSPWTSTRRRAAGKGWRTHGRWSPRRSSTRSTHRAARPRWRRLPDRPQVARACAERSPTGHHGRRQRRRRRAGHVQGPEILRRNPYEVLEGALIAARGHGRRPIVIAHEGVLHRTSSTGSRRHREVTGRLDRRPRHRRRSRDRRVPLRRGDRPARSPRRPPAVPSHRTALPAGRGRAGRDRCRRRRRGGLAAHVEMAGDDDRRSARARRQRRDDGQHPDDHRPRRGLVPDGRHRIAHREPWSAPSPAPRDRAGWPRSYGNDAARRHPGDRGGPEEGQTIKAVLIGVSNAVLGPEQLDTPLTYEDMQASGAAWARAATSSDDQLTTWSRWPPGWRLFLAVESCGQCTPCKLDGLEISDRLAKVCAGTATALDLTAIEHRLITVINGVLQPRPAAADGGREHPGALRRRGARPPPTGHRSRRARGDRRPARHRRGRARPSSTSASGTSSPTGRTTRRGAASHRWIASPTTAPTSRPTDPSPAGRSTGPRRPARQAKGSANGSGPVGRRAGSASSGAKAA